VRVEGFGFRAQGIGCDGSLPKTKREPASRFEVQGSGPRVAWYELKAGLNPATSKTLDA